MVNAPDFSDIGLTAWLVSDTSARVDHAHNDHPDVSLAYPGLVTVTTTSHDVGTLTGRDLSLVRAVDEASRELRSQDRGQ